MVRMMTYGQANEILACSPLLTPNNRCICKSTALANHAQSAPLAPFASNRLVPVKTAGMLYGVVKQYYIIYKDINGNVLKTEWREPGETLNPPAHPSVPGQRPNGWAPNYTGVATGDATYTTQYVPDVTTYTITYLSYDGTQYQLYTGVTEGTSPIPRPSTTPEKPDQDGQRYTFTEWVLNDGSGRRLDKDINTVNGNYTFTPKYNGEDLNDGNVKIFDNIGKMHNYTKNTPPRNLSGDIGWFWDQPGTNGWYSLPHDGHDTDVCGKDCGISPYGAATGRRRVDGTNFYHYDGDSIIYEDLHISNSAGFPTSESQITAARLRDEIQFIDRNGNEIIHIKSLSPWIKFEIIDVRVNKTAANPEGEPLMTPITITDVNDPSKVVTKEIPIECMIEYYIENNTSQKSREGKVEVTVKGGACSYVSEWAPGNQYMTKGTVYFYQLGTNHS